MTFIDEKTLQSMAKEAGGVRIAPLYFSAASAKNGGCGALTYVEGTNGGKMPCGALLTRFGKTAPYLCGACRED